MAPRDNGRTLLAGSGKPADCELERRPKAPWRQRDLWCSEAGHLELRGLLWREEWASKRLPTYYILGSFFHVLLVQGRFIERRLFLKSTNLMFLNVDWRKAEPFVEGLLFCFVPTGYMKTPKRFC